MLAKKSVVSTLLLSLNCKLYKYVEWMETDVEEVMPHCSSSSIFECTSHMWWDVNEVTTFAIRLLLHFEATKMAKKTNCFFCGMKEEFSNYTSFSQK
ncbi:hypothetical protein EGR_11108 [Echinococcus granulosus]|uniref:Uncharacterized protein n=1 Tax=Echinococcus granulosus TaxID=6210 RepID=W6U0R6_ECHGR|nr:hypothetical protein EGR_11108 [Echinococcus granulosus]EUB54036.1 hypothetical protein EGR_11108 [Echinococcus granulosus]